MQIALRCRAVDEGAVDTPGSQLVQLAGSGADRQFQINARVLLAQPGQQRRQAQCGRCFHRTYAQHAGDGAQRKLRRLQQGQSMIVGLQHLPRILQQGMAGRRGKYRIGTHQQLCAYFVFQFLDMGRDIGLHGMQSLGRNTKAAAFADGLEHAQGFELHGSPCNLK